MSQSIGQAAKALLAGGVIAYPTEGVFGLGCLPDDAAALQRINTIKQRDPGKGFILLASTPEQLRGWVAEEDRVRLPAPDPAQPITWICRAGERVTPQLSGNNPGIAVRLTSNPIAAAICSAIDAAITSTSANISNAEVAPDQATLRRNFASSVDYIMPGECGPASGPSEIRRLETGEVLRPGKT